MSTERALARGIGSTGPNGLRLAFVRGGQPTPSRGSLIYEGRRQSGVRTTNMAQHIATANDVPSWMSTVSQIASITPLVAGVMPMLNYIFTGGWTNQRADTQALGQMARTHTLGSSPNHEGYINEREDYYSPGSPTINRSNRRLPRQINQVNIFQPIQIGDSHYIQRGDQLFRQAADGSLIPAMNHNS